MKIYAMGVLQMRDGSCKHDRLWALYKTFEDAERAILANEGDIFEHYYNYAIIEEVELIESKYPNDYIGPQYNSYQKQWWYKIENYEPLSIVKTNSPYESNVLYILVG